MKRIQKNSIKTGLLAVFAMFFASIFSFSGNAFATTESTSNIQKIAILQGVERCYGWNAKDQIKKSDFTMPTSIFNNGSDWTTDDMTILPTKVGNTINDWGLSCAETFAGYSGVGGTSTGFKDYYTMPNELDKLGYEFSHTEGTGGSNSGTADADEDQITISVDSIKDSSGGNHNEMKITGSIVINGKQEYHNGWIYKYYHWTTTSISGGITVKYNDNGTEKEIFHINFNNGNTYPDLWSEDNIFSRDGASMQMAVEGSVNGQSSDSRLTFMAARQLVVDYLKEDLTPVISKYYTSPEISISNKSTAPKSDDPTNANSVYKRIGDGKTSGQIMLNNVNIDGVPVTSGSYSGHDIKYAWWNANHKYALYYEYLKNIMSEYSNIKIGDCKEGSKPTEAGYYFKGSEKKWCQINIPADSTGALSKQVAIVGSVYLEKGTFEQVLAWFGDESSYTYMDADKYADVDSHEDPTNPPTNPDHPDDGEKTEAQKLEEACYLQAKSLGWIICPVIFGLQEVTTGIYEQIEPMIRVSDTVINQIQNTSGNSAMFKAWNTFRGIANIIFVILFLFIIFSQLTGIGIDNYGIKKMLPKVIITAILVNISFFICAIAIDISNILGVALQDLFTNMAKGINNSIIGGSIVSGTVSSINTAVNIIGIAGTVGIGVGALILNGWAIIIPILLFLLTMIISIIFALIVLGLRQAFVVILVVISPIAFACTLLPNTENVFKKWKEFFKQILMVYPIVGGLIGAGYFVACMLLTDKADLIMTITAGMLCVAPYFLVPSLTRKSLDMAGRLGDRLAGAGRAVRGAGRRASNSQAVRDIRGRSRDNSLGRRGLDKLSMKAANWANGEGKGTKRAWLANHTIASRGRMASVARTNQNRIANSRETAYGQAANAVAERQRLESGGYDARNAAIAGDSFSKAVKDYESLITNGEYIGENGQKIGQNDFEELGAELTKEMLKENADEVKINALTNKMLGNGKKGLRALDKAYSNALSGGAGAKAIQGFSNNIKNNHADIADSMPSLFESSVVGAPSGNLGRSYEQFNNEGIGSLNAAKMAKLDKQQLKKYLDGNGNFADYMNDTSRAQLSSLASQALNDDRLKGDISVDNKELLEQIARAGNQPVPSTRSLEGQSESFHSSATTSTPAPANTEAAHNASANTATATATATANAARARAGNGQHALDAYTESVIRRVESGDIKADDGERMIQRAENHMKEKYGNNGNKA